MDFAKRICDITAIPGITGDEFRIAEAAADCMRKYLSNVSIDSFGNVVGWKYSTKENAPTILLDAHIDQIGYMINEIDETGFLHFIAMGVDQRTMLGSKVRVLTEQGPLDGVICSIPPQLQKAEDKFSVPAEDTMVVDIGLSGEAARSQVRVGDYMVYAEETEALSDKIICGKALDDRACLVSILYAMELLDEEDLDCNIAVVASTKEEQGSQGALRAAWRFHPDFAIAVDVCHAHTCDSTPADGVHKMTGGPVIGVGSNSRPRIASHACQLAERKQIPAQMMGIPASSGTNAWNMQLSYSGITTLVVSIPLKYMHTCVEMMHLADIENTGKLLAEICRNYSEVWQKEVL